MNQPNNPLSLINPSLAPTKANAEYIGTHIGNVVAEGNADPIDTLVRLTAIKLAVDTAVDAVKPSAIAEAHKYGKDGARSMDAKVEVVEAGVKYDYSNDSVWRDLKEKIKERETFLKGVKEAFEMRVDDELVTIYPPIRTSTTTTKVTLAKGTPVIVAEYDPTVNATIIS